MGKKITSSLARDHPLHHPWNPDPHSYSKGWRRFRKGTSGAHITGFKKLISVLDQTILRHPMPFFHASHAEGHVWTPAWIGTLKRLLWSFMERTKRHFTYLHPSWESRVPDYCLVSWFSPLSPAAGADINQMFQCFHGAGLHEDETSGSEGERKQWLSKGGQGWAPEWHHVSAPPLPKQELEENKSKRKCVCGPVREGWGRHLPWAQNLRVPQKPAIQTKAFFSNVFKKSKSMWKLHNKQIIKVFDPTLHLYGPASLASFELQPWVSWPICHKFKDTLPVRKKMKWNEKFWKVFFAAPTWTVLACVPEGKVLMVGKEVETDRRPRWELAGDEGIGIPKDLNTV